MPAGLAIDSDARPDRPPLGFTRVATMELKAANKIDG
jgi:hypothetical protein